MSFQSDPKYVQFMANIQHQPPSSVYADNTLLKAMGATGQPGTKKTIGAIDYVAVDTDTALYTNTLRTYQEENGAAAFKLKTIKQSCILENHVYCAALPFSMDIEGGHIICVQICFVQENDTYAAVLNTMCTYEKIHLIMHQLMQQQHPDGVCAQIKLFRQMGWGAFEGSDDSKMAHLPPSFADLMVQRVLKQYQTAPFNHLIQQGALATIADPPQLVFKFTMEGTKLLCHMRNGGLSAHATGGPTTQKISYHLYLSAAPEEEAPTAAV